MRPSNRFGGGKWRPIQLLSLGILLICDQTLIVRADAVTIAFASDAAPRVCFGVDRLVDALQAVDHMTVNVAVDVTPIGALPKIVVGRLHDANIQHMVEQARFELPDDLGSEGFLLVSLSGGGIAVVGQDDSGVLYGCLELARRVRDAGKLPDEIRFADHPVFKLRGTCIAMQKTYVLSGRKDYEYPYTPELFPFFYDKAFWTKYLDSLVDKRMNMLCLWNGHPFASLVKLPDYPEALEVSEEQFAENCAMFRFITDECDRRGIWLVQNFYNILLPRPLADRHGLSTQLAAPTPLAADYTRKAIAEFVRQYPNVGLYVCLGEAMLDVDKQTAWCTEVILPGVKDGMRGAGLTNEPPLIIRAHATDLTVVMPAALKLYKNLYTEAKFNGESLTTWEPRGPSRATHLALSRLGSTHIANIHILANLEPFRYGATEFIRKSTLAARDRLGWRSACLPAGLLELAARRRISATRRSNRSNATGFGMTPGRDTHGIRTSTRPKIMSTGSIDLPSSTATESPPSIFSRHTTRRANARRG